MSSVLELTDFKYGIIKRMDAMDIPIQAASDSDNIDGDAPEGKLQGIPVVSEYKSSARGYDAKRSAWIVDSSGKWNLVYVSGDTSNTLKVILDWYGSFSDSGLSVAYNGYSFVVHNQECHIGCGQSNLPQWFGYCNYGHFGGSTLGWTAVASGLDTPNYVFGNDSISLTVHSGTNIFDADVTYQYAYSYVYDYTQESLFGLQDTWINYSNSDGEADYLTIKLQIADYTIVPNRMTSVKIYRREINTSLGTTSLFRLMKTFDLTSATGWTNGSGNIKYATFVDDNGTTTPIGATYEQETGIAETISSIDIHYTLNCEANNYMFITGCAMTGIPDASHMVFRSQAYRYDMFNWSAVGNYLKLKTQPTALVTFNNRVWAFDQNNIYVINPDSMIVEETIFGIGCLSQRSVLVTPYGMFWCDTKGAYWHDKTTINTIGDTIKAETMPWHGFLYASATDIQDQQVVVSFSPVKNYIMFIVPETTTANGRTNVWAYNVAKKRWDSWTNFTSTCGSSMGSFTGKNGEVYLADGTSKLYDSLGGATKRAWNWTSGDLPKENQGQKKLFYCINTTNTSVTSAPTFTYGKDSGVATTAFTVGLGTVSVAAGGSGYSIGDILTLASGTNGTVLVGNVDGSGAVTSVSVLTKGSGYTINTYVTSGGGGSSCTINVVSISNQFVTSGAYDRCKTMRLKISDGAYGNTVSNVEMVYRNMEGMR